ncbi:MAG: hypothetical protein JWL77_2747 [Chthonomonadaceae bacterium]|nr:hypothetical protein [Chthonomonadaceae bacterium]
MFPVRMISVAPARKIISRIDVQALGLVLMILMVIDLPIYHSATKGSGKQVPASIAATQTAPITKAPTTIALANGIKTDVPSPTKKSGASNSNMAH